MTSDVISIFVIMVDYQVCVVVINHWWMKHFILNISFTDRRKLKNMSEGAQGGGGAPPTTDQ